MDAIEIQGLTKTYAETRAVDDLSFSARRGRVTGFLGPNGAGKTTTLGMLLGLVRPDSGTARIDGRAYRDLDDPAGSVGALLDPTLGHQRQSGRTHLRVIAAATGRDDERVEDVLQEVGLADAAGKRLGAYSMGMRQRLALATALLGDPEALVLDEPANGLDPAGIRWLREWLRTFADSGGCAMVSSHQLAELARSVDDIVVIAHGQLRAAGAYDDVIGERDLEEVYLELTSEAAAIR